MQTEAKICILPPADLGSCFPFGIFLDGIRRAVVESGKATTISTNPGPHSISIRDFSGYGDTEKLLLKPGETAIFQYGTGLGRDWKKKRRRFWWFIPGSEYQLLRPCLTRVEG